MFQQICSAKIKINRYRCISSSRNKKVGQDFYLLAFLFFNRSSWHCHLYVFRHYKWESFKKCSSYSQTFAKTNVHNTTLINELDTNNPASNFFPTRIYSWRNIYKHNTYCSDYVIKIYTNYFCLWYVIKTELFSCRKTGINEYIQLINHS